MFALGPQSNIINAIHSQEVLKHVCDNSLFTLRNPPPPKKKEKKKKEKTHKMYLQGLELIIRPLETFAYFSCARQSILNANRSGWQNICQISL